MDENLARSQSDDTEDSRHIKTTELIFITSIDTMWKNLVPFANYMVIQIALLFVQIRLHRWFDFYIFSSSIIDSVFEFNSHITQWNV